MLFEHTVKCTCLYFV